ncbi:MAG: helix-turn-helix domain-containing protein [Lachnospiraceae bacterium]|nr:helix-turn-helix domain-containing protein [Lachnospiraceae bacterium]
MEIGNKLKKARTEKGFTQEQTADALGVSRQTISNWENDKSYPDIISVIKMSEIYSISLDHLLKEEISMNQKQTYMEYLEESTNAVKAKRNLEKIILFSVYFLVWAIAEAVFWLVKGPIAADYDVIFKWILLPLLTLASTAIIARNDYWGKANWFSVLAAAVIFLAIPQTQWIADANAETTASFIFKWPNFSYMAVGIFVALCGMGMGSFLRSRRRTE